MKVGEVQDKKIITGKSDCDTVELKGETEDTGVVTKDENSTVGVENMDTSVTENIDKEELVEELVEKKDEPVPGTSSQVEPTKNTMTKELGNLIKACRAAEPSEEMKKIIKMKLLKYYHSVHPDFVTSKNFLKSLKATTEEIVREPHLVYANLKIVIDELDTRRKSKAAVLTNAESVETEGTGDAAKDEQLKKLQRALVKCKRMILNLEEAEVDWEDDDNSAYLKKVRFEKRACEIYEKICEITGESTDAHRTIKKPIKFKGTDFPEFNKKLQKMVNKHNSFPNYREVLKCLDYCNKIYNYRLATDQLRCVAQGAFEKLGQVLQRRRKADLYESTTFYVGKSKDPAKEDPELRIQLEKNRKNYAKYDDVINE